jgi:hypothetical protein
VLVSDRNVSHRRKVLILPILGVLMFALGSYQSVRLNRILSSHKCYYWSVIRLDREPLNRWLNTSGTCNSQGSNCKVEFDYIQIDPGAGARNETSESASADGSVFLRARSCQM